MERFGTWKRYKCDGEEELFKFLGLGHYYQHSTNVEVMTNVKKTDEGIVETYTRGDYKVTTTASGETYDQLTINFGPGKVIKLTSKDVVDGTATFEMDGMTRSHKREYKGTHEYTSTNTFKKGDKTVVSIDYFRKVV